MIAPNSKSKCKEAELYYYDYLHDDERDEIPEQILQHIDLCKYCRLNLESLIKKLSEIKRNPARQMFAATIATNLELHFAYANKKVTCRHVKPFLPVLADTALKVRILTPITSHIDNCRECSCDIKTIRQLNLSQKQLYRLGQLFAEEPEADTTVCYEAQQAISMITTMSLDEVNPKVLKHLSLCSDCREQLFQQRKEIIERLYHHEQNEGVFSCEKISFCDVFDYVLPYFSDLENDRPAKFRLDLTSHLVACPVCLGKIQYLYKIFSNIIQRQDSGIITCLRMGDPAQEVSTKHQDDIYSDWPIKVEVYDKSDTGNFVNNEILKSESGAPEQIKEPVPVKRLTTNLRTFTKPFAAAAAISILALLISLLIFRSSTAKALDLSQVYEVLGQVKNICVSTFSAKTPELIQTTWTSHELNITALQTKNLKVLSDLNGKSRKTLDINTGAITTEKLDNDDVANIKRGMGISSNPLPFDNLAAAPPNASWKQVTGDSTVRIISNTVVYDLIWEGSTSTGRTIYMKWQGYIDIDTKLPKRVEMWEKFSEDLEYKLVTIEEMTYPSPDEIWVAIRDIGL